MKLKDFAVVQIQNQMSPGKFDNADLVYNLFNLIYFT